MHHRMAPCRRYFESAKPRHQVARREAVFNTVWKIFLGRATGRNRDSGIERHCISGGRLARHWQQSQDELAGRFWRQGLCSRGRSFAADCDCEDEQNAERALRGREGKMQVHGVQGGPNHLSRAYQ